MRLGQWPGHAVGEAEMPRWHSRVTTGAVTRLGVLVRGLAQIHPRLVAAAVVGLANLDGRRRGPLKDTFWLLILYGRYVCLLSWRFRRANF